MRIEHIIILALTFVLTFGVTLGALWLMQPDSLRRRITQVMQAPSSVEGSPSEKPQQDWLQTLERMSKPLAKLSLPGEGWDTSAIRTRFMTAGWRNPAAIAVYFGAKTVLAVAFPALLFVLLPPAWNEDSPRLLPTAMLGVAIVGFYLPDLFMRRTIRNRQRQIFETFPDALDLITVCVEAGLALDAALLKVVEEFRRERNPLGDELELLVLELRAGLPREKALRNLALRTGVDDVEMLVSMLIQADRFGTSVAESLRVHADSLRVKRRQRAEETAAKIAVKLLFPLIFFIFPSLMVVLLGSPALGFYRTLMPAMMGAGG
ncbi:type II secretion system F family protein [Cupriavidus sp. BIC8F]|uniref:type II secretion system F family protein n=1 Tax=Cupriavidus sp. BIC8F TaxID=3079014 RepID=UPI002915CF1C|nr:type II secretion system F family protein [Cupriavidus sp. BIC8F]